MDILNSSWLVYFSTPNKCEKSPFCLQITVEWGVVTKVIYYWCADECRLITPLEKKLSVIFQLLRYVAKILWHIYVSQINLEYFVNLALNNLQYMNLWKYNNLVLPQDRY